MNPSKDLPPNIICNPLIINSIEFSKDKSIIILATNQGYRVYDTTNYTLLSNIVSYQEMIGPLAKASVLYSSQLIYFNATQKNSSFSLKQLVIWNDSTNRKEGLIILNEPIVSFTLLSFAICINVPFRLLIFDIINLRFVLKLEDQPMHRCLSDYTDFNRKDNNNIDSFIIAHASYLNKNIVKLNTFNVDGNTYRIASRKEMQFKTDFSEILNVSFGQNTRLIIVVSKNGNKIHLYEINTYKLRYCIYLGQNKIGNLGNFCFDYKEKYLMFIINQVEMKMYKLYGKKIDESNYDCICSQHEDQIDGKKKTSFFGNLIAKMLGDITSEYASYGNIDKCHVVSYQKAKSSFHAVMYNGYSCQLIFNRKSKGSLKIAKGVEFVTK